MPCYNPIVAHQKGYKANGKANIVFDSKDSAYEPNALKLPCGHCIGCLLRRAQQWAIRCVHESKTHEKSCFITLTYSDKNLPENRSISPYDFQCFVKRLRKALKDQKIRYFHCGEYGKKLSRPHYHAIIFGYDFPDRMLYRESPFRWYRSKELEKLWTKGFSTVADLTESSAAYVARYTLKKVYGDEAANHYKGRHAEYITMSRRPGIGREWYNRFKSDIYPAGVYVNNGVKIAPPKYYDKLYEAEEPEIMKRIKSNRQAQQKNNIVVDVIEGKLRNISNNDTFRLAVRERIKLSQIRHLKRIMEEDE